MKKIFMAAMLLFIEINIFAITIMDLPDGSHFEGNILNGKFEGYGKIEYQDGAFYEGNFSNGLYNYHFNLYY